MSDDFIPDDILSRKKTFVGDPKLTASGDWVTMTFKK